MTIKNSSKGKHLTIDEREMIENGLSQNWQLKNIANFLKKDPSTISKEIRRNRVSKGNARFVSFPLCQNLKSCTRMHLCSNTCSDVCKSCKLNNCMRICPDYAPQNCIKLERYPYVCNACTKRTGCRLQKYWYRANIADAKYRDTRSLSRMGIDMNKSELALLDDFISPLLLKGQSIAHIYATHKDEIGCCERTLYSYIDKGVFKARNIDLPRKVRYKPRKKSKTSKQRNPFRKGRSYDDFNNYLKSTPEASVFEMDTVHGKQGESGKVLLTLLHRNSSFMFAFLLESCTQECVIRSFELFCNAFEEETVSHLCSTVLADNGSEFLDPLSLENDELGNQRIKIYYCDPMASWQKGQLEKNHEYIRYILPKGTSFENLTQEKVTLMINHINSTNRASLNGTNPFKLAQLLLGETLLKNLNYIEIPADDIHLKPTLIK